MSPSTDDHIIEKTEAWGVKGVNDEYLLKNEMKEKQIPYLYMKFTIFLAYKTHFFPS